MYLKRKIDEYLQEWKNDEKHLPLLVVGIRQCGKTESIKNFGQNNYKNVLYLNFWDDHQLCDDFNGELSVKNIINILSLRYPNIPIIEEETLIIFDEIQECPRARLFLKNIAIDSKYDVIATGSFLGINGYIYKDHTPVPVGYETIYKMKTLDFEEFLWANGYNDKHIKILEESFNNCKAIDNNIHELFKKLFQQYMCVGGFPKAVSTFIETHNISDSSKIVEDIIDQMKSDFGRRLDKRGNPLFKPSEVSRIITAFDLIPTYLAKENKRFILSGINNGSSSEKRDSIKYLEDIGVVYKVYNLNLPSLPLDAHKKETLFKLFPTDIGIICTQYGYETLYSIYSGNLGVGKGALYEAAVLDSLYKADIPVYYYAKNTGLEIDFVVTYDHNATLIEAKAKTGNTKASKTVLSHPEIYGKTHLIKIGDYNVGKNDNIMTIPHYMTFLLGRKKKLIVEDLSFKQ